MLPRLLDRHLVLFGPLAAAVDLAVGLRDSAEVVRGEGELPARRARRSRGSATTAPSASVGLEQEELRRHRVDDVDRGDAAVAEVLLGEEERLSVLVGDDLGPAQVCR